MRDRMLIAPAVERNREPILNVLREVLPEAGFVLEVASGSGEHVVHFAAALPGLTFQPSDPDTAALESIAAWTAESGLANILPPLRIDAAASDWPVQTADAVIAINMVHISPWRATQGLFAQAGRILPQGGVLYLYGPYRRPGRDLEPSNLAFDESLRQRDAEWGLRDLAVVTELAATEGFGGPEITEMPANNLSLVFRRL